MKVWGLSVFLIVSFSAIGQEAIQKTDQEIIKVAAIDWCPQLCNDPERPGYVSEILSLVMGSSPFIIDAETLSWSRAIYQVRKGRKLILLSPAKAEAPDLIYPDYEIGVQRMCFFTRVDNPWNFTAPDSLKNMVIGIGSDTSIPVLNEYIKNKSYNFQAMHYDHNFIDKNLKMLDSHRIDAFIFTQSSAFYELRKRGLAEKYKVAGCVSQEKIYMALTNDPRYQARVEALRAHFDTNISQLYASGEINRILQKYEIDPWR